jgi:hypothetical protein
MRKRARYCVFTRPPVFFSVALFVRRRGGPANFCHDDLASGD